MLNAAMIGLGWWGKELVRSQQDSKLMRFTHGVTLEPDTVRDFAAEMNLKIGTRYENILADKSIDCVVLATPHSLHRQQVEAAAAAGKHVFCEKPFALTLTDAKAMIAACRENGVLLMVDQTKRYQNRHRTLKRLLDAGYVGEPIMVRAAYLQDITYAWQHMEPKRLATYWKHDGVISGIGIHVLDLLRWQLPDANVTHYQFRAVRPLFDIHPFDVCGEPAADGKSIRLWAKDHEGWLAMEATARIA